MGKPQRHVFVCVQTRPPGHPRGSCSGTALLQGFQQAFEQRELWGRFGLTQSGCLGPCETGPNVLVYPEGVLYSGVTLEDIPEIIEGHLLGGVPVARLYPPPGVWGEEA